MKTFDEVIRHSLPPQPQPRVLLRRHVLCETSTLVLGKLWYVEPDTRPSPFRIDRERGVITYDSAVSR